MLKLSRQGGDSFNNYKCGEIFCITAAVFNVSCCLCGSEMPLEQFPGHFQIQHLTLEEDSINLEVLKKKRKVKSSNDTSLLEHMTIKEEGLTDGLIKQEKLESSAKSTEVLEEDTDDDEDNKCLQELLIAIKAKENKLQDLAKLKEDSGKIVVFTRNDQSHEILTEEIIDDPLQAKECDKEVVTSLEVENLSIGEVAYNEVKEDNDDAEMEWSADEIDSEVNSDPDKTLTVELPFPCPICKRSYRTKHSLQKHNHSVHNPNKQAKRSKSSKPKHQCDICNEVFRSALCLRAHQWKHTGIFCDICGRSFTQSGHLRSHMKRHTGIKDFKCKECNKEFFTSKELKSHMVSHTKVMPVICEICGKGCRNMGVLTAHMRRHTGERPAKCDVCGKCFFSVHDLNVHAVTHTTARPFKCDICNSTFQSKKALRVHKRIHSKDRKHVCRICGKGFSQSTSLNMHLRTHDAAVEKTTCGNLESSSVMDIPAVMLINHVADDTIQKQTELEEQVIGEYMV